VLVGLQQCTYGPHGSDAEIAGRLTGIAQGAEENGFASFWLMDHLLQIGGWGPVTDPMLDVYTALGFVAARTGRIRIGPLVLSAVYRPASVLIKAATTLDVLAGGRTYFGIGAAWFEHEARALGLPFPARPERYRVLEDVLRLARKMWAGDSAAFNGKTFSAAEPVCEPMPISQPRPRIMVGGRGPRKTLGLVARYADAWNVIASPAEGAARLQALRDRCAEVGRDPSEIETTVLDPDDWRREEDPGYSWSPDWELARLRRWKEIGFDHVIVNMSDAHDPAKLRAFGEVIAAV
jgi:F420-dependent oxidoreductase-like protein